MYGDQAGPNGENGNDCHNLSTWNWTGLNCPHLSNTAEWLIASGAFAVLCAPYPGLKICERWCGKKQGYESV